MWERITDIAKTASAMLYSGKVPPNTPPEYQKDLSKINFLASKKFYVVFCSVIILAIFYAASIFVLFLTAPLSSTITTSFVTIFVETIKILAIIIASYLGLQTALDFKYNSNNNTDLSSENTYSEEKVNENVILKYVEKYKDDPSYAPLEWIQNEDE